MAVFAVWWASIAAPMFGMTLAYATAGAVIAAGLVITLIGLRLVVVLSAGVASFVLGWVVGGGTPSELRGFLGAFTP